jgi:hypothetical protein
MADLPSSDTLKDRLARIQDLWDRLQRVSDPKQRALLEKRPARRD